MACDATCAYRESELSKKLFGAFLSRTGDHLVVASGINALVTCFFKVGDLKAGVIQGVITALVFNIAHCISHHVPGNENDEIRAALFLVGVFFATVYFFPDMAVRFGREETFKQSCIYGAISWTGIALCNQFYR